MMSEGQPTREAIVDAADAIREAHHEAMKRTVSAVRICQHSVRYQDKEVSALHNKRMRAKEAGRRHRATQEIIPQGV